MANPPNPPRIPEFYTPTKIHKPTITGRPIMSGYDGPTERISSFVDTLLQPISKIQKSYLKDTTDFINFIENTKVKKRTFLVSMDVTSLYTNIPQNEGLEIVCKAYENFYKDNPLIGSFENQDRSTKHPNLENEEPKSRKRRTLSRKRSTQMSKTKHPISKTKRFPSKCGNHDATAENKVTFLDTIVYKGKRSNSMSILDVGARQFKPTETIQYTHFTSCHPLGVKKGFIKGEALLLLGTNSSKQNFQNWLEEFQKYLRERGYPQNLITLTLSEIHFENRKEALQQKPSRGKNILSFVAQYQPSRPCLKNIHMKHWQLIENQPLLRKIYNEPPIISYKRGRSLKDILVKAKLWELKAINTWVESVRSGFFLSCDMLQFIAR